MAGISFSRARQGDTSGGSSWGDWITDQTQLPSTLCFRDRAAQVCYEFNVDYTSARSLVQLGFTAQAVSDEGAISTTYTVGAYIYTSDPTVNSAASLPPGYVASSQSSVQSVYMYATPYNFAISGANATTAKIYVILRYLGATRSNVVSFNSTIRLNTVSATFKGYPTSLSVSPASVSTGSSVSVSIGNAWTTETVRFYYNSTQLASITATNGGGSITVPKSWFTTAGVTSSTSITVQARVDGTSLTNNFTVTAGNDMKPTVGTPSVTAVNATQWKVAASASTGSNAGISTVKVSYGSTTANMSYNSSTGKYEVTIGTLSGNTTFTVTATDARGLSGSASYTLSPIPSALSATPATVQTGGNISISITNARTSETVRLYYGSTQLATATISKGSGTVTVQKSWFTTAGITTSQTMSVTIRLDGTSHTKAITVQAGTNMKPTVGTLSPSIVQDSTASAFPSTYIANLSKVKVRASVSSGSNAGISTVKLSWSGGTVNMSVVSGAYEATVGPLTGNTTLTVTATDARGMTGTNSYSLTGVKSYSSPVITINESQTYRCNSGGTKTDGGTYVRARANVTITTGLASGSSDNSLQSLRFYIQEEPSKSYTLANNTQSGACAGRDEDYYETLVFEARDKIRTVTKSLRLPPRTRNIAVKRSADGTYVGIGVLPQSSSGKSRVDLPEGGGYFDGGYLWGSLTRLNNTETDGTQFAKNFLNVDASLLHAASNTEAFFIMSSTSGWSNYPVGATFKGLRKVIWINSSNIFVVILEAAPTVGRIWVNYYNGSAWSGWKNHAPA